VFTYNLGSAFSGNLVLTVTDPNGKALCRMDVPDGAGLNRVAWDLRVQQVAGGGGGGRGGGGGGGGRGGGANTGTPSPACVAIGAPQAAPPDPNAPFGGGGGGGGRGNTPLVPSGRYTATLGKLNGDSVTPVGRAQAFVVTPLLPKNWGQ
jgi:hypothetical protein